MMMVVTMTVVVVVMRKELVGGEGMKMSEMGR